MRDADDIIAAAEKKNPPVLNLPPAFWKRHPVLAEIRAAAHARWLSADAVLGCLLARTAAHVSPRLNVDTGISETTSLNLPVATIGAPGAAKSMADELGGKLLPSREFPATRVGNVGSGEGIAELFMGEVPTGEHNGKGEPVMKRGQAWHNAFVTIDEGEVLTKLGERSGATLGITLRSAAMGKALGQALATKERTRHVEGYALGLVAAFQPEMVRPLLAEEPQGTPQRFLFVSAVDPSVPKLEEQGALFGDAPGPVTPSCAALADKLTRNVSSATGATFHEGVTFPRVAVNEVWRQRAAAHHGELEIAPLDAHRLLVRLKVAALLMVLLDGLGDGKVTEKQWELAGEVLNVSCAVRDDLVRQAEAERRAAGEARKLDHIDREVRTDQAKHEQRIVGLAQRIRRLAAAAGDEGAGITGAAGLRLRFNGGDRGDFYEALDYAAAQGWVSVTGEEGGHQWVRAS
jgi:hypothetical protein